MNVWIAQGAFVLASAAACVAAMVSLLSGHGMLTLAVRAGASFVAVGLAARLAGQLLAPLVLGELARAEAQEQQAQKGENTHESDAGEPAVESRAA